MRRATLDRWVMVEHSDKMWSTGEWKGKPLLYSFLENPTNSMKRQKTKMVSQLAVNGVRSSVRTDMGPKGGRYFTKMRQWGLGRKPTPHHMAAVPGQGHNY